MCLEESADPELKAMAAKVMCHTPGVKQSNYSVVAIDGAARVGRSVLDHLPDVGDDGSGGEEAPCETRQDIDDESEMEDGEVSQHL